MSRPVKYRVVGCKPGYRRFGPCGGASVSEEVVTVTVDELEAMRLGDMEGMYHEEAAKRMQVSRGTFGNIIESARRKVAEALVGGKTIEVEGGTYHVKGTGEYCCAMCSCMLRAGKDKERQRQCPRCGGQGGKRNRIKNSERADE